MTVHYQAVGWNPQKKRYDRLLLSGIALYLLLFLGLGFAAFPEATAETLLLRATSTCAMLLLCVALAIGPLCRIDSRFLPLLYNRRHLGVATFCVACAHGMLAIVQFHALGNVDPLVSLLASESSFGSVTNFPFQILGLAALLVLFVMAATSHDFWLKNLGPAAWKSIHMTVYVAWALVVLHVGLGALQQETSPLLAIVLCAAAAAVLALHLVAGARERRRDRAVVASGTPRDGLVDAGAVADFPFDRGRVVVVGGERVAIFRHEGGVSAISNLCRHQGGPLGEGRILDGCVTCPWHGYQYRAADGCSPPPFTEKVETYRVTIESGRVRIDPRANPPGTAIEPARP